MLKVVFWDVQHGHAAYVRTEKKHIAIDMGTGSYADTGAEFSPLLHLKNKYGVSQLDAVVVTHPHSDHIYDVANFDALSPRILWRPKHLKDDEVRKGNCSQDQPHVEKYLEINRRYSSPVEAGTDPFRPENNGGVTFQVFTPKRCATSNLNNHSLVTVISHASSKIIIPGDNECPSWNELLEDPAFCTAIRDADILLAPHHGRESGFSAALFEHISPRLTIVSDGAECDTSATDRYTKRSQGWVVHNRKGGKETRKCLTTRNDGVISVELGIDGDKKPYIHVAID